MKPLHDARVLAGRRRREDQVVLREICRRENFLVEFQRRAREPPIAVEADALAMDVLAYRQLRDVAVGAKRELKLAVIDPYPLDIQRMTLEATRLPDKGAVRRFEVRAANVSFEIGIDAEGFPVEHPDHERLP
jgi:hypothetical protein